MHVDGMHRAAGRGPAGVRLTLNRKVSRHIHLHATSHWKKVRGNKQRKKSAYVRGTFGSGFFGVVGIWTWKLLHASKLPCPASNFGQRKCRSIPSRATS